MSTGDDREQLPPMPPGWMPATEADAASLRRRIDTHWLPIISDLTALDTAGALGGIRAVITERLRQVRGEAQMPDEADMPYAAFDTIKGQVRLSLQERDTHLTAFAAALLAAEIDRMADGASRS